MRSLAASPIGGRGETSAPWTASAQPVRTARRGAKRTRRSRRPTSRRCRVRQRARAPRNGSSDASDDSSAQAARGRLSSTRPTAARSEVTAIHRARAGAAHHERPGERDAAGRTTAGRCRRHGDGDPGGRPHAGSGHHDHPAAGVVSPPAEVQVGTDVAERGLPPTQGGDEVALHERPGEGDGQRVGHPVVLALVRLARRGAREEAAAARRADLQGAQEVRVGGVHVLGPDDAGGGGAPPGVHEARRGRPPRGSCRPAGARRGPWAHRRARARAGRGARRRARGARVDGPHVDRDAVGAPRGLHDLGELRVRGPRRAGEQGAAGAVEDEDRVGGQGLASTAARRSPRPRASRWLTTTAVTVGSAPSGSDGAGIGRAGARVMRSAADGAGPRVTPRAS